MNGVQAHSMRVWITRVIVSVGVLMVGCTRGPDIGIVSAGPDIIADEGTVVVLVGTAGPLTPGEANPFVELFWEQTSGSRPPIVGIGPPGEPSTSPFLFNDPGEFDELKAEFTAPFVEEDTIIEFVFEARDGKRAVSADLVKVLVRDIGDASPVPPRYLFEYPGGVLSFDHVVGVTSCSQSIGTFTVSNGGGCGEGTVGGQCEFSYSISNATDWIDVEPTSCSETPCTHTVEFNCFSPTDGRTSEFRTGELEGSIDFISDEAGEDSVPVTGTVDFPQ